MSTTPVCNLLPSSTLRCRHTTRLLAWSWIVFALVLVAPAAARAQVLVDLTQSGTAVAKVTVPLGSGNKNLAIIRDGDKPPVGSTDPLRQYDTWDGTNAAADDWVGYTYAQSHMFTRVVFQEGMHFFDGGWFDSLTVQVRQGGVWQTVTGFVSTPTYPAANNGINYETYTLDFDPTTGDGVRIYGAPGGAADFISVAELEVYELQGVCGDGTVTPPEECEPPDTATCNSDCTTRAPLCGDGFTTPPEQCDDGNLIDGDGCTSTCQLPGCGNNIVEPGEVCDDGNLVDGDGCDSNCTPTGCGNGVVTAGEDCDTSGESATCNGNCTAAICGDGTLNRSAGEICDDGNTVDGDGCQSDCTFTACGDGAVQSPEECDDGNNTNGDGCSADCQLESAAFRCAGVTEVAGNSLDAVRIASGLSRPVDIESAPLDPNRLYVVEQAGTIRLIKNGVLQATPFLDLSSKVPCCGEQGLLGLVFHPDYENNRRFFVNYVNLSGNSVIARYERKANDPDQADPTSEKILLTITQPGANHNGGKLAFGPDGYLYAATGDGGTGLYANAQDDASMLGKVLRIDADVDTPPYYAVPADNPRVADGAPLGLIWAKGLRNPWRFSFDRETGDLYIADVGESSWEEVDFESAQSAGGINYGWGLFEGDSHCFDPSPASTCPVPPTGYTMPILEYSHTQGCSIIGGYVYRGCQLADLQGTYFYSDFCSKFIRTFTYSGSTVQNQLDRTADLAPAGGLTIDQIVSYGEDARGELYLADLDGEIYKIVAGGQACGDGLVTVGEECDDGGESATCDADCTFALCGDGTLNTTAGEVCDDGNAVEGDGCDSNCTVSACGNGVVAPGESCDDGGESATCDADCTPVFCGDGTLNTTAGEECDDGNTIDGDGCSSSCLTERLCGDANGSGTITASDGLLVLKRSVGIDVVCPDWLCDVDSSGLVTSTDALRVLRRSVGLSVAMVCPNVPGILFRLVSNHTLGALQITVDYTGAAGDFNGAADAVACTNLVNKATAVFNKQTDRMLKISIASVAGFTGPTDLAHCEFTPTGNLSASDFVVTVVDAVDPDDQPVTPLVQPFLF